MGNKYRYIKLTAVIIFTVIFNAFYTSFGFVLLAENNDCLYYTEKNLRFVRVFCKILYTLFIFNFTKEKIPLYNTEKNLSFVDVFLEKFTNYFHAKEVRPKM